MKQFQFANVIGRWEPVHNAHIEIMKTALTVAEKVNVIIGSDRKAPDPHDPFSSEERMELIDGVLEPEERRRVSYIPIMDYLYNENDWLIETQNKIAEITEDSTSIALVGHKSDLTSYYLDSFPSWSFIDYKPMHPIHATKIRELYFSHDAKYKERLHKNTVAWMEDFKKSPKFMNIKESFDDLNEYWEKWRGAPFVPTFNTIDSVVVKSGHVLVVVRGGRYGKGLLALPGGFLDPNETRVQGAIRELKEETSIALSKQELFSSITARRGFDHPRRSLRGRTITEAFKINLGAGPLPKVKGGDDASGARWLPMNVVYAHPEWFFEDHWHIIYNMNHQDYTSFVN
jgi:bifunctional NMN adenylyltransferase/nudix hydrolase